MRKDESDEIASIPWYVLGLQLVPLLFLLVFVSLYDKCKKSRNLSR